MNRVCFNSLGTLPGIQYTREEGVRLLCDFQNEMIMDYKSRFGQSLVNRKYFVKNLEATADAHGLGAEREFQELRTGLESISEIIATWKSGLKGEERAAKALARTLPGEEITTLFGVTLKSGREQTEYDAVVITPYGVFAIEVKSYSNDMIWDEKGLIGPAYEGGWKKNLGERMNCKEYLLRNKLKDMPSIPCYSMLLIADNRVKITDKYGRIPVCYLNTVLSDIRSYSNGKRYVSKEQMEKVRTILLEGSTEVLIPCPVDCRKVAEEYSWFVGKCLEKDNMSFWDKVRAAFERKKLSDQGTEIA